MASDDGLCMTSCSECAVRMNLQSTANLREQPAQQERHNGCARTFALDKTFTFRLTSENAFKTCWSSTGVCGSCSEAGSGFTADAHPASRTGLDGEEHH